MDRTVEAIINRGDRALSRCADKEMKHISRYIVRLDPVRRYEMSDRRDGENVEWKRIEDHTQHVLNPFLRQDLLIESSGMKCQKEEISRRGQDQ